ncbi:hypothetical protein LLEC1_02906 [Akanthomyces lecanii]|uniref:MARVEL domain-containing protein n=1 Tax=Cordyceps confragosa TaxID=2714763 RepID=A0A179ID35_CORDF|nr:hypothetical protein LLEC1_02906 [Akanthomyces lecanii]
MGLFSAKERSCRVVHRKWPKISRKATVWLMPLELAGLIAVLVIFGIAQPDLYRTKMWQIGFDNGLNSNPDMILYAYANFKPLPKVPLIWSSTPQPSPPDRWDGAPLVSRSLLTPRRGYSLTNFNVAISVISLFFLLAKLIAFIMKLWFPIIAVFVNMALLALYSVSVYGQIGPDYADPRYPAPAAWYFRQGCGLAKHYGVYKSCQIAQGSLAATFYMHVLYILNLGFAIYAMWPRKGSHFEDESDAESIHSTPNLKDTEMQAFTSTPFTPRTQAFHTLDRKLPLRQETREYR